MKGAILRFALPAAAAAAFLTAPAAAQGPCGAHYTVRAGDTLYSIANRCGTSVSALARANGIADPRRIEIGARLRMPTAYRQPPRQPEPPRQYEPPRRYEPPRQYDPPRQYQPPRDYDPPRHHDPDRRAGSYRVQPGDTLYSIARRFGTSVDAILSANARLDPYDLRVGTVLRIPGRGERPGWDGRYPDRPREPRPGYPVPDRPRYPDRGHDFVEVTGVLTREGVECPVLRGFDGRLYTLAGETGRFGPGDTVTVRGSRAQMSYCQQGTTIDVRSIEPARR